MASLNLDLSFLEHRKTKRLVARLGEGAEIYVIRLWVHCGKFHPKDGYLKGYAACDIESEVLWRGEQGRCVEALTDAGFLKALKRGYQVHDWKVHNSHIVFYSQRASAAAAARWSKHRDDASSIATRPPKQCPVKSSQSKHVIAIQAPSIPGGTSGGEGVGLGNVNGVGTDTATAKRELRLLELLAPIPMKAANKNATMAKVKRIPDAVAFLTRVLDRADELQLGGDKLAGYVFNAVSDESKQPAGATG